VKRIHVEPMVDQEEQAKSVASGCHAVRLVVIASVGPPGAKNRHVQSSKANQRVMESREVGIHHEIDCCEEGEIFR
jgi:hypothetical protein